MEHQEPCHDAEGGASGTSPPKAPNPAADSGLKPEQAHAVVSTQSDHFPSLIDEHWHLSSVSALGAVRMLIASVQALADATGDIPPTPPISRPTTPSTKVALSGISPSSTHNRSVASPSSPVSPLVHSSHPESTSFVMPSPEAHRDEALAITDVGADTESISLQRLAITRRFFLKTVPPFTLSQYLMRLHQYCPHSPGVYFASAAWIHRLCVAENIVPATSKTVHRLTLAAIRIASKALEDHKWSQDRIAKVGGVSQRELKSLEVNLCFLLDFELFVREDDLKRRIFLLQQAAKHGLGVKEKLSDGFKMRLPVRQKVDTASE